MSSSLDFTWVSLHLTALSLDGQSLEMPYSGRPATLNLPRPRPNAVYSRPATTNSKTSYSTFRQNEAKYIVFGINEKLSMRSGL